MGPEGEDEEDKEEKEGEEKEGEEEGILLGGLIEGPKTGF